MINVAWSRIGTSQAPVRISGQGNWYSRYFSHAENSRTPTHFLKQPRGFLMHPQATLHDVVTYGEDGKSRNLYDQTTYTFGTSYLVTSSITVRLLPQVTIATIRHLFTSGTNIVQRVKPWKLPIRVPEHFYRAPPPAAVQSHTL